MGCFRTFLLASVSHPANEWDRQSTQKRGGGRPTLSLDSTATEARLRFEPIDYPPPRQSSIGSGSATVLTRCLETLRDEQAGRGEQDRFERLKVFLTADQGARATRDAARALALSESAVRVAVHRLRKRFSAVLREEVAGP